MYVPHYWHVPLNTFACHIAHLCPAAFLLLSTYGSHITQNTYQKSINCNIYLPNYCILQSIWYYTLTYFRHNFIINNKHQMLSPNE